MNWIKLDERKPEDGQQCLVYSDKPLYLIGYWNQQRGGFDAIPCYWDKIVTHWQPLPDPPQESE